MVGPWEVHVAIIEDDNHLRNSIRDLLDTEGYSSALFESADRFLQSNQYEAVGCILADVRMPGTSGIDMLKELKARPGCPPILIMTSYSDQHTQSLAIKHGADGFFPKPLDSNLLLSAIQNIVGNGSWAPA
ncbi:response regulator transcription factor [Endobacterium cereale]|uniref:response regulator transcription factor n=1 Tax=Endobacterium cereale TaxID=2663029 RepID=UPI0039797CD8